MNTPEFPVIAATATRVQVEIPQMPRRYVVIGYWPRGGYWSLSLEFYESESCAPLLNEIQRMIRNGWTHIHVVRIPLGEEP